jgi:hypothetical protein
MTGIAADEDLVVAHLVDDQAAPNPVFLAEQFVFEERAALFFGSERDKWVKVIKAANIHIE